MNADHVPGNVTYYDLHFASEETEAEHIYQSPQARKWRRWHLKPRTLILGAEQLQRGAWSRAWSSEPINKVESHGEVGMSSACYLITGWFC